MAKPVELGLVLEGEDAKRFIESDDNPKASPLVLAMITEGRELYEKKERKVRELRARKSRQGTYHTASR
jgi:hypothetical protein